MIGLARSLEPLVDRARSSWPEGADDLLREVRPLVYRWAWVRTADADDAEDVTQAVLLRVYERIEGFEGRSSFTTWLYRVTANAAAELGRRNGTWSRLRSRIGRVIEPSTTPEPLRRIEAERTRELVETILDGLPERQRCALDLVDLQGYQPIEAAAMLEMNPTTLRVHLLRARRTVRRRILEA